MFHAGILKRKKIEEKKETVLLLQVQSANGEALAPVVI